VDTDIEVSRSGSKWNEVVYDTNVLELLIRLGFEVIFIFGLCFIVLALEYDGGVMALGVGLSLITLMCRWGRGVGDFEP